MQDNRNFFKTKKRATEHGGMYAIGSARSKRPIQIQKSMHLTLKSDFAYVKRSLLKYRAWLEFKAYKSAIQFNIKIYQITVCNNHIHLLVRGRSRRGLQNFFRVFAGHSAQKILKSHPISNSEKKQRVITLKMQKKFHSVIALKHNANQCKKNQRKFWSLLIYSRVVFWGRDFGAVKRYIIQNFLESLNLVPYKPRKIFILHELSRIRYLMEDGSS